MSKDKDYDIREPDTESREDDSVAKLLNLAGPRADIPADIEARVHGNVRREWRSATTKKTWLQWAIPAALAATILIVLALNIRAPDTPPQPIGTIAFVADSLYPTSLVVGDNIYAGDSLETGTDRGVSIALAGEISLRIAANTAMRFDQSDELTLLRGAMYADSGDRIYRDRHLTIHTPGGVAKDIGTQFSVAYENNLMSVSVREGRVDVAHDQATFTAAAGDRLVVQAGSDVIFDKVTPYDPYWDWASSLAPGFDIEGRTLLDFLKWAARETGKSLMFSSEEVRMAAMGTELFGSIKNFTPTEAVDAVLPTTQFNYQMDDQSITIEK